MHSLKFALSSFAGISLVLRVGKLEGLDHTRYVVDYTRSDSDLFVRLDPGEEIHAALKMLADDLGFDAAAITSGIGRTRDNCMDSWMKTGCTRGECWIDLPN